MRKMREPFGSPKSLIRHAREGIEDLKAQSSKILKSGGHKEVIDYDPQTGGKRYKIVFGGEIPSRLEYEVNNILNNLRHSLDQGLVAAVERLTGNRSGTIYFPIRTTPDDLNGWIGGKDFSVVPAELHPIIRAFEPYPRGTGYTGGNDLLAAISKIVGPNKHQVTVKAAINLGPEFRADSIQGDGGIHFMGLPPRWDMANNEMVLAVVADGCKFHYDIKFQTYIAFGDAGPLLGHPVIPVLDNFAGIAERIVLGLEAETDRILRTRNGAS
jgi:hypothetical protein